MEPTISVIIPTYNRAGLIKECIVSVLNQTYKDFEIIVIDDGSTDNTKEIVSSFSSKVRYIYQQNTGLPAKARNKGILQAKGKYIAFLDSDDKWKKNKLARQIDVFEKFPWVDLVSTGIILIDDEGTLLKIKKGVGIKKDILLQLLKNGNFITNSSVLVKKDSLLKVNLLDEEKKIRGSEDFLLWVKLASFDCNFYMIPDILTFYRKSESSICTPLSMKAVYDKIFSDRKIYRRVIKNRNKCLAQLHYELSRYYFSHKDFYKAAKEFLKMILKYPIALFRYVLWMIDLLRYKPYYLLKKIRNLLKTSY